MVPSTLIYKGELHCELTHGPSQSTIETDAPVDNNGRGAKFSPTDLIGAALSSCVVTTMAIVAERDGVNMVGATAYVEKHMNPNPRRIARLPLVVKMPAGVPVEYRQKLKNAAETCPVHKSLHPDIDSPIEIIYPD
jgi:putative redox protein